MFGQLNRTHLTENGKLLSTSLFRLHCMGEGSQEARHPTRESPTRESNQRSSFRIRAVGNLRRIRGTFSCSLSLSLHPLSSQSLNFSVLIRAVEDSGERFDPDASRGEIDSIQPFERSIMVDLFPYRRSFLSLKTHFTCR